jgi:hypothetical protein
VCAVVLTRATPPAQVIFFYQSREMSLGPGNIVDGATPRVAPAARL